MDDKELEEFRKDCHHLKEEIGKFLNKWHGKIFKPLEKALEMLEAWL